MKKSELQELIREVIDEVLNEVDPIVYGTDSSSKVAAKKRLQQTPAFKKLKPGDQTALNVGIDQDRDGGVVTLEEDKLNEMAWGVKDNKLQYYKKTSLEKETEIPQRLTPAQQKIIDVLKQKEGEIVSDKDIQSELGLARPQMINNQLSSIFLNVPSVAPKEPETGDISGSEEDELTQMGLVGGDLSDEEIEASFTQAKAAGEEEDTPELEKDIAMSASSMSDQDYADFIKYTDLSDRLNKVKGDLNRMKRSKLMAGGDIKDKPSTEEKRLRDLKVSLEQRVNDLVAGSEYLQKRQAKKGELDEWAKKKMQYYAGIIE